MLNLVLFATYNLVVLSFFPGKKTQIKRFLFFWCLGFCVAVFLPSNFASHSTTLKIFVEIVSYMAPIGQGINKTDYPEISSVYYSIVLLGFPFACSFISSSFRDSSNKGLLHMDRSRFRLKQYALGIFGSAFFTGFFFVWWFLYGGEDTRFYSAGSSRIALALFGSFLELVAAALATAAYLMMKKIIFGHCWATR